MNKNQISSARFTWPLYIGQVGFAVSQVAQQPYEQPLRLNDDVVFLGWCKASELVVRQRDEGFAVMVEMDNEKFWFHCTNLPN